MIHNLAAFGNFLWGVLWGSSFGLSVGRLVDWSTRLYSTIVRLNFFLVCSVRRSPYWGFCLSLRIGRGCAGYIGCGGTVFLLLLFFCCFSFCLPRILKTNTRKVQPFPYPPYISLRLVFLLFLFVVVKLGSLCSVLGALTACCSSSTLHGWSVSQSITHKISTFPRSPPLLRLAPTSARRAEHRATFSSFPTIFEW